MPLTAEENGQLKDIMNAIGPSLAQAISDGVFKAAADVTRHTANLRREQCERELWSKVYASAVSAASSNYAAEYADKALALFKERFK
jgi:hypothetical protein